MENGWKNKRPTEPENSTYGSGAGKRSEPENCAEYQARRNNSGTGQHLCGGKVSIIAGNGIEDGKDKNPQLAEGGLQCKRENLNGYSEQAGRTFDVSLLRAAQEPIAGGSNSSKPLVPHTEKLDAGSEVPPGSQPSTAAGTMDNSEIVNVPKADVPAVDSVKVAEAPAQAVNDVGVIGVNANAALSPIEEYEDVRTQIAKQLEEAGLDPDTRSSVQGRVTVRLPDEAIEINFYIPALRSPISASEEDSDRTASSNHTNEGDSGLTHDRDDSGATSGAFMQSRHRYNGNTQIIDYRAANLEDALEFTDEALGSEEEHRQMYSDPAAETRDNYADGTVFELAGEGPRQDGIAKKAGAEAFVHMEAEGLSDATEETAEEDTELKEFVDQECRDGDDNAMGAFAADIEESEDRNLLRLRKKFAPNRPARLSTQRGGGRALAEVACRKLDSLSQESSVADESSGNMELTSIMPDNGPLAESCEGEAQSVSVLKAGEQIGPVDGVQQFSNNAEALAKAEKRPETKRSGFREL